jgi:short-subunit dehydrogenase
VRAVVTGATSGIGKAFAQALASRGCDLVISGRRKELLAEVATELRSRFGVQVRIIAGDFCATHVEQAVIDAILEQRPDYLINNAGTGVASDFVDADAETLENLRDLLSGVPGRLMKAALPAMVASGTGTIINVGSLAGRLAVPGSSVYTASKIYLERLSETLAIELHRHGIVVQALIPGYVRTDFHRAVPDYKRKQRGRGFIRWLEPEVVVARSLKAAERARALAEHNRNAIPRPRDVVVMTGRMNRFLSALSRLLPRRLLYRAAAHRKRLT